MKWRKNLKPILCCLPAILGLSLLFTNCGKNFEAIDTSFVAVSINNASNLDEQLPPQQEEPPMEEPPQEEPPKEEPKVASLKIISKPPEIVTTNSAEITFEYIPGDNSTLQCRNNGVLIPNCSSPLILTSLENGSYEVVLSTESISLKVNFKVQMPEPEPDPMPEPDPLTFTSAPKAVNITTTSAVIEWSLSEKATGQVQYGKTMSYGSVSTLENSFNYNSHQQQLSNLDPDTTYHFRVVSKSMSGQQVTSANMTFKTLKPAEPPPPPPPPMSEGGSFPPLIPYNSWVRGPVPTDSQPSYLAFITDSLSGSRLRKITTNTSPFPTGLTYYHHKYPKVPLETGDYVFLDYREPGIVLKKSDYSFVKRMSSSPSNAYPSLATAGRVYGVNPSKGFIYVDIATNKVTEEWLFNKSTYNFVSFGSGEGTPSNDERYWPLLLRRTSGTWDVAVLDRLAAGGPSLVGTWQTSWSNDLYSSDGINFVAISQSGQYVIVGLNSSVGGRAKGIHVFNRNMVWQRQLSTLANHADAGLTIDGKDVWIQVIENGDVVAIPMDGSTPIKVGTSSKYTWMNYISARNIHRPGYFYHSTMGGSGWSNYAAWNKVVAVEIATGKVEEWCHSHHAENSSNTMPPMAVPSPDGKRVYFASQWGNSSAPSLLYVCDRP